MNFKNYKREYLMKDIISGIIVALISIPISMGYSQVAGLPVVYGLYGSLFPDAIPSVAIVPPTSAAGAASTPNTNCGDEEISPNTITGKSEP